jgi:GAF domain-containing protein
VVSVAEHGQQLGHLLDAALQIADGDKAWFILREDEGTDFVLRAYRNLPPGWAKKLNMSMDDGLSSLVLISGQPLIIHGRPMEKFKVAALGKSAAVLPVKGQDQVLGAMVVVRKEDREVEKGAQPLLEAIADLASIAVLNARLVRAMESSAQTARRSGDRRGAALESMRSTLRDEIRTLTPMLERLMSGDAGPLTHEQQKAVNAIRASATRLATLLVDSGKVKDTG